MSCACSQAARAGFCAPWLLVAIAGASIRLRCYRNQSLMGRRRQLELWQPRLPSVLLPLVRFEGMRVRRRLGPGTIGPWADAQHPYFKSGRARATRKYRARASPSRVSALTERQPTWGRVDGRQGGSPALWWGCHGANAGGALTWWSSSCRPVGRPKRTASVTLGQWGRRRAEGGVRPHATQPTSREVIALANLAEQLRRTSRGAAARAFF